jgi:hypothetical protein
MQPDEQVDFERWFKHLQQTECTSTQQCLALMKEYINAAFACGIEWGYKRATKETDTRID